MIGGVGFQVVIMECGRCGVVMMVIGGERPGGITGGDSGVGVM